MPCSATFSPTPAAQFGTESDQVQHRTGQSVQSGDDQGVTLAEQLKDQIQLGPEGFRARCYVDVDVAPGNPSADEGIDLVGGVLVGSGDAAVSDQHGRDGSAWG
jgi:hypothetical protein